MQKDQLDTKAKKEEDTEHQKEVRSKTVVHNSTDCIPLLFLAGVRDRKKKTRIGRSLRLSKK